jgi:hypothetical protein
MVCRLYDGKDDRGDDKYAEHAGGFDGPGGLIPRQVGRVRRNARFVAVAVRRGQNDSTLWMLTNTSGSLQH